MARRPVDLRRERVGVESRASIVDVRRSQALPVRLAIVGFVLLALVSGYLLLQRGTQHAAAPVGTKVAATMNCSGDPSGRIEAYTCYVSIMDRGQHWAWSAMGTDVPPLWLSGAQDDRHVVTIEGQVNVREEWGRSTFEADGGSAEIMGGLVTQEHNFTPVG